jgi:hypothetical protein
MRTAVGFIMLVAYFSRSLLIKGGVYFNNDECKAACWLCLVNSMQRVIGQCKYKIGAAHLEQGWPYAIWN